MREKRSIRSYVLRQGRMTRAQTEALAELWSHYGLEVVNPSEAGDAPIKPIDFTREFGRAHAPRILEIGFGNGATLAEMAAANPHCDYIGIEVHRPGVGALLLTLNRLQLTNVRVFNADAISILTNSIPDASLNAVYLFFPDPWPKKRHHKRRIVQPEFIKLIHRKLAIGGILHMATDWQDYANHMLMVLRAEPGFSNTDLENGFAPRPDYRPMTKFERRGKALGHGVWDLIFVKNEAFHESL